ncbi:putative RNA polymerase I subunit [Tieghemostelium lacteum]|uniref:Putative RNA polymerase I subunit n=1 Tax=Tieghemostelium lacteum TaxID=361077 RepID=A0A151Z487_TIELA|nr:putative RNA polymerase I subunit [Tieghemostelium lacteum]|eukprot:KYQ88727.1 putative RNA polymerase I subunit [Tieghemostelium lacteum]
MTDVNLNVISEKDLGNKPCVIKFPCGLPPQYYIESEPKFQSYSKKISGQPKRSRVILSATEKVEYESNTIPNDTETHLQNPSTSSKFAMGVYDKSKNTLTLIPTDIYDMKQSIIGYRLTLENQNTSGMSKEERYVEIKKLANDFGSKITKKKMQKMEMENVENLDIEKTAKAVGSHQNLAADKESDEKPLDLPPFNKSTSKEVEVYPIDEILPIKVYFHLNALTFSKFVETSQELDSKYPKYFNAIIQRLKASGSADTPVHKDDIEHACKILSFMYFTILLLTKKSVSELTNQGCHHDIKNYLLDTFAHKVTKDKIFLMDENRIKIINYMVILSLHLEDFVAKNVPLLAQAVSMTVPAIEKHYLRVGCKSHRRSNDERYYSLETPLQFPKSKFAK